MAMTVKTPTPPPLPDELDRLLRRLRLPYLRRAPTIADRIAQTVAAMFLEPLVEPRFHRDSAG
jgi:hypothetical protein